MSVTSNIKAKHANDVHDELQQLSLEMLFLFQWSIIRGKLQIIRRILIYVHLSQMFAMYCHVTKRILTKIYISITYYRFTITGLPPL